MKKAKVYVGDGKVPDPQETPTAAINHLENYSAMLEELEAARRAETLQLEADHEQSMHERQARLRDQELAFMNASLERRTARLDRCSVPLNM